VSKNKPDFYESEISRNTDFVEDSSFRSFHNERRAREKKAGGSERDSFNWLWFTLSFFAVGCLVKIILLLFK
jgi:hypothetical protein